jgi:Trk K+ transport system NAD-binding subunit
MNILILGAGRVGESVAENLVSEQNDITVIDTDPRRLAAAGPARPARGHRQRHPSDRAAKPPASKTPTC